LYALLGFGENDFQSGWNDFDVIKVGIYSPYLDTLGGGERYMLTFVEYCLQKGFNVDVWWDKKETLEKAVERFSLKLDGVKLCPNTYRGFGTDASYASKIQNYFKQLNYDLIFWLSDGSIPFLHGKQNWIHFQVPFQIKGNNIKTQYKLSKINQVICNSQFTKKFIDKSFNIVTRVIYPPVDVHQFMTAPKEKEHIILSVGRFDQILNAKRQDVLIEVFKQMCDEGLENWELILVGGLQHNQDQFLQLQQMALNYPIKLLPNLGWSELVNLYKRATIYWHAAGFGIDDNQEPEKVEHFGMSIVEAMAAGCIPIACDAGGVGEIILNKTNGYLWRTKEQLAKMTTNMINTLAKEDEIVIKAQKRSLDFAKEKFFMQLDSLL